MYSKIWALISPFGREEDHTRDSGTCSKRTDQQNECCRIEVHNRRITSDDKEHDEEQEEESILDGRTLLDHQFSLHTKKARKHYALIQHSTQKYLVHTTKAAELGRRRNELNPIGQLPVELLCGIFLHLHDTWPCVVTTFGKERRLHLGWAKATHVCHHWRKVAIQYPQLWNELNFQAGEWLETVWERSQNAHISIDIQPGIEHGSRTEDLLSEALSQLERLQSLTFFPSYRGNLYYLPDMALDDASAPNLEKLVIKGSIDGFGFVKFSDAFLSGGTPRLRHLEVMGYTLLWSSPLLSGLRVLKLAPKVFLDRYLFVGVASEFYDALEGLPGLEELTLHYAVPLDVTTYNTNRVISFPGLQIFDLKVSMEVSNVLLQHLTFPTTVSFHTHWENPVSCTRFATFIDTFNLAISSNRLFRTSPSSCTTPVPVPPLHAFQIGDGGKDRYIIRAWRTESDVLPIEDNLTPSQSVLSMNIDASLADISMLQDILEFFPLNDLLMVELHTKVGKGLYTMLRDLPSLSTLLLTDESAVGLFNYTYYRDPVMRKLTTPKDNPAFNAFLSPPVLKDVQRHPFLLTFFSSLHELVLSDVDFRLPVSRVMAKEAKSIDFEKLVGFLKLRKDMGHPIHGHTLSIYNSIAVNKTGITELEKFVAFENWDGTGDEWWHKIIEYASDDGDDGGHGYDSGVSYSSDLEEDGSEGESRSDNDQDGESLDDEEMIEES